MEKEKIVEFQTPWGWLEKDNWTGRDALLLLVGLDPKKTKINYDTRDKFYIREALKRGESVSIVTDNLRRVLLARWRYSDSGHYQTLVKEANEKINRFFKLWMSREDVSDHEFFALEDECPVINYIDWIVAENLEKDVPWWSDDIAKGIIDKQDILVEQKPRKKQNMGKSISENEQVATKLDGVTIAVNFALEAKKKERISPETVKKYSYNISIGEQRKKPGKILETSRLTNGRWAVTQTAIDEFVSDYFKHAK